MVVIGAVLVTVIVVVMTMIGRSHAELLRVLIDAAVAARSGRGGGSSKWKVEIALERIFYRAPRQTPLR
jgi:hypothetical protein